jgi:[ribosomal protein S5]-alanine N-acetyltransferase
MRLTGNLCAVRRWTADDVEALVTHADNVNIARQLRDRFPHPYTRVNAIAFLKHATGAHPPTSLAIEVDRQAVGGIGYVAGTDVERYTAEIGYWLSEQYWGRGIVTEAVMMVTTLAFTERNLLRLYAVPFADNIASMRVLEKAGYVREGVMRASSVKYGQPRDQAMYARVNPNWNAPSVK